MTGRYRMSLVPTRMTDYPEPLLRAWAKEELGAARCSDQYLKALRMVLGNMARADRFGALLHLTTVLPFDDRLAAISRQTMRTLLEQFKGADLLQGWETPSGTHFVYQGKHRGGTAFMSDDMYARLARETEDADFERLFASLGLEPADVPY